jgi:hypothetical protein
VFYGESYEIDIKWKYKKNGRCIPMEYKFE